MHCTSVIKTLTDSKQLTKESKMDWDYADRIKEEKEFNELMARKAKSQTQAILFFLAVAVFIPVPPLTLLFIVVAILI